MECPLCTNSHYRLFHQDKTRDFFQCHICDLVFVHSDQLPNPESEKKRYLQHENSIENEGYVRFLYSIINALKERVPKSAKGLDYGSGPNPVLAELLRREGYEISIYDPFFAKFPQNLSITYDFLTCVETVEHFHYPKDDWERIVGLVKPGGWLGVKTEMLTSKVKFDNWHYMRDYTHVAFYSKKSFEWIAENFNLAVEFEGESMAFFQTRKNSV